MSDVNLSSLKLDGIEDIEQQKALPAGNYLGRISNAELTNSKAGNPMLKVIAEFPDEPTGSSIFHFINMPIEDTPEDQARMRLLELKRMLVAFGCKNISSKGVDPSELIGQECELYVSVEQDQNGIDRNRLNMPKIK